ncbi:type VI secretion system ATPase TssH [Pseudomonas brassicacearum]|uniref:type VI secretion system ATPase TssH n=1 Tax=Pseudomonas brassicacearum TaxID=930166 RepID=UPI00025FDBEC|nr:type VI secretion system ATPase TssH [Pseudomonas brassicacearum]EIK66905.1 type VI secretion ATPase ClpV3 [Pseudomonas fluorescens Q8r1-96]KAB0521498.1 type VI secretion system ATPase TssH [Pseudomonas brassicacearum subsp. brassicacearum]NJP61821.1 type VI secretion system ATPase TssH [Pseudomonas brassicacearum]QEO79301.1 type VI secretion system ATPase TssH [Pseudomonas brassicacearum]SDP60482.1 type VI secretion system protein VasG [Pseudomonas brassicacearum]
MELASLIGRLNPDNRRALERAAQRCMQRSHHYVEIEHLLLELLDIEGGDFACLLPRFGLERDAVATETNKALDLFKSGSTRTPALSAQTIGLLEDAVVQASVLGLDSIRSGLLLLALLDRDERRSLLLNSASSLLRIPRDALRAHLLEWTESSREHAGGVRPAKPGEVPQKQDPVLDQYTQDLTADARAGRIDPIVGRDGEIRQCIDILLRRRQNNPILVGAPGVGKTAVVEGLALRIAAGDVPPSLQEVTLRVLDLGLLQAGAGVKGEFEQRLKGVIDAVRSAEKPIILFIDEAHTLIGAGGAEGGSDAANLLKPALARGELRTLAATTWLEYKKYFEKDPALARRFQLVQVEEPDELTAVEMLRGVASKLEQHHGVQVLDAAIHEAVKLSHRYISGRQLPDKAISVLDTACARVALGQHDVPPPLESLRHRQNSLKDEVERLRREQATGLDHRERITLLEDESTSNVQAIRELETRWGEEREAVRELLDTRRELLALSERADSEKADTEIDNRIDHLAAELLRLEAGLDAIRQDDPLVPEQVDSKTVAAVIAGWTGIPVGKMLADEAHAVRTLGQRMGQRVMGQSTALNTIAQRLQAYRAGLTDPQKPVGVFLLVGPTGVGKTETAYALADALYGGERNLISINLSEYQEAHTVSQLKGAPPGYIGYGSGGVLTEAVRRKPYSVVLLDEIEKAHPDVLEAFYNVFDKGLMEDGTGLVVDFKNTVMLATSNVGAELLLDTPAAQLGSDAFNEALHKVLLQAFRPAFLARMTVVAYRPLDEATLEGIVLAKLEKLRGRYKAATGKQFEFDAGIVKAVLAKCSAAGARDVENVLMTQVTGKLAEWVLE